MYIYNYNCIGPFNSHHKKLNLIFSPLSPSSFPLLLFLPLHHMLMEHKRLKSLLPPDTICLFLQLRPPILKPHLDLSLGSTYSPRNLYPLGDRYVLLGCEHHLQIVELICSVVLSHLRSVVVYRVYWYSP